MLEALYAVKRAKTDYDQECVRNIKAKMHATLSPEERAHLEKHKRPRGSKRRGGAKKSLKKLRNMLEDEGGDFKI